MTNINLLLENPTDKTHIIMTLKAMFNKKLLPERSKKLLYDSLDSLVIEYRLSPFKEISCNNGSCSWTARGPKTLLHHHQKVHADKKEIGENEYLQLDYKLY